MLYAFLHVCVCLCKFLTSLHGEKKYVSDLQSADTVKMLSATQQTQEEVARTKQQLSFEVERIKQESDMKVPTHTQMCHTQFL